MTSAVLASRQNMSRPAAALRSTATERLFRFSASKCPAYRRGGSPPAGRSTSTTSAPISASSIVANGPGYCSARLRMRIPRSGASAWPLPVIHPARQRCSGCHRDRVSTPFGHDRRLRVRKANVKLACPPAELDDRFLAGRQQRRLDILLVPPDND